MARQPSKTPVAQKRGNPVLLIGGIGAAIAGLFLFTNKGGGSQSGLEVVGNPTIT